MKNLISVAILAGGQSSRMGTNKAFVRVGGKPIVQRIIERVRELGSELFIIANTPDEYAALGVPVHPDIIPGKGPLGGLYTAIWLAGHDHTLVVSCDQPFLNAALLQYIINLREGFDVVVPLASDGYPQSMHAIYGKSCLEPIRANMDAGKLRMIGFFSAAHVREVSGEEIDAIDPERRSFINVNSPGDLQTAELIAHEEDRAT